MCGQRLCGQRSARAAGLSGNYGLPVLADGRREAAADSPRGLILDARGLSAQGFARGRAPRN
eukprot:8174063-Alexandrium_andersonii.AAC.1